MEQDTKDDLEHMFKTYYSAHREGKLSEAEKGYRDILKKKPDWGRALNALGNLFLDQDLQFDLIYSSDVFVYFGNLDTIITSASSYLVSGGKLAFSVEHLKDHTADYQLYPTGRFAHSQHYIQECLDRHGLTITDISKADIRNQSGHPVKGLLIVAMKKNKVNHDDR